ncbi:PaaI family thioesterase [Litchfieldia alkalitelluris]|uniref:PaaI family thioesterase n=1 Tax=Litchfieldia alkalitelluris TaxID=304268 RepID=UPI000997B8C8|nr:PaaI family thioesterase [Litchfieldia alkalitelluris]
MDEQLLHKINDYYSKATDLEKKTFEQVINGLIRKQEKPSSSYLGELLQVQSNFVDNQLEMIIPNTEIIQNSLNIVHGGITATLIDSAMGSLIFKLLPNHQAAVTTELKINYLAPGLGSFIKCIASLIHKGSNLIVTEAKVYREDGKLMAHATGSFFIIKRKHELK